MTRFPHVISVIPAIFLILYRWRFLINFISKIFLYNRYKKTSFSKTINKSEALEILGLNKQASKDEILKRYQELMKKNHPDIGGSEWITKKLNQARETLLG
ncbi:MAG: DnaJ domain-containing protein [Pseudomonadota bacterium]|nr:DnaJ domain-containing protein [Pseudomonadota bacterium]